MSKKIASLIVVMCTLVYSAITLNYNYAGDEVNGSIRFIGALKSINFIGNLKLHNTPKVIYDDVKQKSTEKSNNIETSNKGNSKKEQKLYIMSIPKSSKDAKLSRIHQSEKELLNSIFSKAVFTPDRKGGQNVSAKSEEDGKQNAARDTNKIINIKKEDEDVSAFSIQNSSTRYELNPSDKERLLSIATMLSPIDQAKINEYLKDKNLVINAINLLRDRLSDIEFEKVKDIAKRYNKALQ